MAEREWAAQAAAGDAAAFSLLVRDPRGGAAAISGATYPGDADDLAQDVFVKAWRQAANYRGDGNYRGWLFRIGWTAFLDAQRSTDRREAREQASDIPAARTDHDLRLDLNRALKTLPSRERARRPAVFRRRLFA